MTNAIGVSASRGGASRGTAGLTTTVLVGGATVTTGRVAAAAPIGALATTGPAGGFEAMAGAAGGGITTLGACLGAGTTIFRGSTFAAGAAGSAVAAAGGAVFTTATGGAAGGRAGTCGCRASCSASSFFARIALAASPGLEICEKSNFGAIPPCEVRDCCEPPWPPAPRPRSTCARTFSASSNSSELE